MPYHTNHIHSRRFAHPRKIKWSPPQKKTNTLQWTPPQHGASPVPILQHTRQPEALPISQSTQPEDSEISSNVGSTLYYGLYGGSSLPDKPVLFVEPAQAIAWSMSRFYRDGLANIYGPRKYPDFLYHVGTVTLASNAELHKISIPRKSRPSKVETAYWHKVRFYSVCDSSISVTDYTRLNKAKMDEVIETFHPTPCYQLSSGSIYKSICPSSGSDDVKFVHSQSLSSRLRSVAGRFIQIERNFHYIKTAGPSPNIGKTMSFVL